MTSRHHIADSAGLVRKCGDPGIGFRLVPSVARDAAITVRPGNFPVAVRLRAKGGGFTSEVIEVVNSDAHFERDEGEEFGGFDLEGAEAGDSWLVQTFARKSQGVIPAGSKTRRTSQVLPTTALTEADPTGSAGFRIRPGTLGHNFAFSGTLQTARIWARMKSGNWIDTGEDIDATAEVVAFRTAYVSADRLYLMLNGGFDPMSVEVDCVEEVG